MCVSVYAVSISHQLAEMTGLSATFRGAKEKLLRVDKHTVIHINLDMTGCAVTNTVKVTIHEIYIIIIYN